MVGANDVAFYWQMQFVHTYGSNNSDLWASTGLTFSKATTLLSTLSYQLGLSGIHHAASIALKQGWAHYFIQNKPLQSNVRTKCMKISTFCEVQEEYENAMVEF